MSEPTWRGIVVEGWKYDRWANSAWLGPIIERGDERDKQLFGHILAASKIWVTRLDGVSLPKMPELPLTQETIDQNYAEWINALARIELDQRITSTNTRGEVNTDRVADIVRHAQNHGTYHRGQLREMFGAKSLEFPETDWILYSRLREEGRLD